MKIGLGLCVRNGSAFQSPNLLPSSNSFATYTTNLTIVDAATADPYGGGAGASAARTTTGSAENMARRSTTQAVSSPYAVSLHAKAFSGGLLYVRNIAVDDSTTNGVVQFNLSTGTAITTYGSTYIGKCGAIDMGGGWWRCWMAGSTPGSIGNNLIDIGVTDGTTTVGGVSGNSIYVYGWQLNAGLYPSTYDPN